MSIERLTSLEGLVERLRMENDSLKRRIASTEQQVWQTTTSSGTGGGGGGPVRIRLTAGIAAGSMASPSSASAYLLKPDGTDGTSITVKSEFATALTGSKYGWAGQVGTQYYLMQADC